MGVIRGKVQDYYFARYPRDRTQVEGLLHWFDVTHAERASPRDGAASIYYLKPTSNEVGRFLGIDPARELLYLYSPHPRLEAREIEGALKRRQADALRLDPHLLIVGSDDPQTGQRVKSYVMEDLERPPMVGLSRAELVAITKGDELYSIVKSRHFVHDYFAVEAPLTEEALFFGRNQLVAELTERVGSGQNSGLFGLRRIGKTSVLLAVQRRCKAGGRAFVAYRDLSPAYHLRWWKLLELLVQDLASDLHVGKSGRRKINALTSGYSEESASISFGKDIEYLAPRAPQGRICLLLDEIEYITFDLSPAEHWQEDFLSMWSTMRSVHQNSLGRFTYLVAGVNPYSLEHDRVGPHENPLFTTTRPYFLAPLNEADADHMVRTLGRMMGLSVTKDFLAGLFDAYGGHPYLMRRACSHLAVHVPERPGVLERPSLDSDRPHLDIALAGSVRQILLVLETWYPLELELLEALANGDSQTFLEFSQSSPEFSEHVVGYGLVEDPMGDPRISIDLVREVLRELPATSSLDRPTKGEAEPSDGEWDEMIAEISRRRNRLERELRKRTAFALQLSLGQKRMGSVLDCLSDSRRTRFENLSYEELWDELYFNDLKTIIEGHWPYVQNWLAMDASKFTDAMVTINQGRADAHARSMDSEELAYLRVCLKRLEGPCGLAE
ncbi:MAG: hypothetical protein R2701_12095 [Acidimicrobiales bacterium]